MSERTAHPLYTSVSAEHRWHGGSLPALFLTLTRLARRREWSKEDCAADRDFDWMCLPQGAVVGLRLRGDMDNRLELRIARRESPETPAAQKKWQTEVATFLAHFEIIAGDGMTVSPLPGRVWQQLEISKPGDQGKAVARFLELRHGECQPGKSLCAVCLRDGRQTVVTWHPVFTDSGQRCDRHLGKDAA